MRANLFLSLLATAAALSLSNAALAERPPDTPQKPVATKYHGLTVEDPYQWLENDDDSQVKAWSDGQSQRSRKYLDGLPDRAAIEKQLSEWYAKTSPSYFSLVSRPGILFAMKFQPPKQQPLLVTLASADDLKSEKIVLDPNVLDTKGRTTIDWFVPSLNAKYVAVSLSTGGSEDGTLHFYEAATGKALPDAIAHVQYPTAGGSAAWNADGTGVYYTRFPRKGERPDADLNFYQQIFPSNDALYAGDLLGGPSQIRRFDLNGKNATVIPIPQISSVQEMLALENGLLLFRDVSYTAPATWFQYSTGKTEPAKTALW